MGLMWELGFQVCTLAVSDNLALNVRCFKSKVKNKMFKIDRENEREMNKR
jgi:hypothetical protein